MDNMVVAAGFVLCGGITIRIIYFPNPVFLSGKYIFIMYIIKFYIHNR